MSDTTTSLRSKTRRGELGVDPRFRNRQRQPGLDLFFVLSGYLIGGQLLAPLAREQSIKLGRFFARRVLRIMPAFFVVLAIYFLLPSWREYSEMSQPLWKFLLSVQNIALHGGT